jgi:hypothetical protein
MFRDTIRPRAATWNNDNGIEDRGRIFLERAFVFIYTEFQQSYLDSTIAIVTGTLWGATRRLWQTSRIHADHMERSVKVAQRAAEAARDSADTLPIPASEVS